jgi:hypothetical protein
MCRPEGRHYDTLYVDTLYVETLYVVPTFRSAKEFT